MVPPWRQLMKCLSSNPRTKRAKTHNLLRILRKTYHKTPRWLNQIIVLVQVTKILYKNRKTWAQFRKIKRSLDSKLKKNVLKQTTWIWWRDAKRIMFMRKTLNPLLINSRTSVSKRVQENLSKKMSQQTWEKPEWSTEETAKSVK